MTNGIEAAVAEQEDLDLEAHAVVVNGRAIPAAVGAGVDQGQVYKLLLTLYEYVRDHPGLSAGLVKSAQAWFDNGRLTFIVEVQAPKGRLTALHHSPALAEAMARPGVLKGAAAVAYRLDSPPTTGRIPKGRRGAKRAQDRLRYRKCFGTLCQQLDLDLLQAPTAS